MMKGQAMWDADLHVLTSSEQRAGESDRSLVTPFVDICVHVGARKIVSSPCTPTLDVHILHQWKQPSAAACSSRSAHGQAVD